MYITNKIDNCLWFVNKAEMSAKGGNTTDSQYYWKKAVESAIELLDDHEHSKFLEEELKFLKDIIKHLNDEDSNDE